MTKEDALKQVKKFEAFQLANKFAIKNGCEPLEWDGEIVNKIKAQKRGDTLLLNFIGPIMPFDSGEEIIEKIQNTEASKIKVNINSPGGDYYAAVGIANALRNSDAEVTTNNLGLAASAGAILMMAGDERLMGQSSQIMIHNVLAGMILFGNAAGLEESKLELDNLINELNKTDDELAKTFSDLSNLSVKDARKFMNKETFFNSEEAIENGLATGEQKTRKSNKKTNTIKEVAVDAVNLLQDMLK